MNKIKKGLVGIALGSILAVSGCSSMIRDALVSEEKSLDRRNSKHVEDYRSSANEKSKSNKIPELGDALRGYGCICETEKMDEVVARIIKQNIEVGMQYDMLGEKYHKMCEK